MTEQEENDIELIEAYYRRQLDAEEMKAFEDRIFSDNHFAHRVKEYTFIMDGLKKKGESDFIEKVQEWEKEIGHKSSDARGIVPIRRIIAIAATVLIILIPVSYLIYSSLTSPVNEDQLFAQYFVPFEDVISQRSSTADAVQQGMNAYNEGSYQKAITLFNGVSIDNPRYYAAKCYSGIAYLVLGEANEAEKVLKKVAGANSGLYKEVAEWYLALAYLKGGHQNRLKHQLSLIKKQPDHTYLRQARGLYDKID